ncbi:hypothetical protein NW752_009473 [Fusarium irregulare]|uniref:Uncharacterized protein n=1 Tax=Fusarium irregulare TaxID=2494466 RepID=A0A9W8PD64_9HYPO|nr:hypothetical protein NW766_012753 [Fusarium irregulare]KAJ4009174.1 hypothetical protein NW752_009473 [Fusarium irregulare]
MAIADSYRQDASSPALKIHGASDNPGSDLHATVRALQRGLTTVLQTLATIAPSFTANPEPGLRPTFKKESPLNDHAPTVKQEPLVNEPATPIQGDAALSHKLLIAGIPTKAEDEFHHEPPSYEDSDSGSHYDSFSDEDDEIDEVAVVDHEAYQEETSDFSSVPSSQETAEPVCARPSSPVRHCRFNADDGELDDPPFKKVRSSSSVLQPEVVTHIKSEDNTQSTGQLEFEHDSESEAESQSNNHPVSEPNLHVETLHYSVHETMDCLCELVTQLGKPDGIGLSIIGTELAFSANGTGDGTVPPSFHGRSLNMTDQNKVRFAVIDLFKHYSTIMVRTERKVDVVVL